MLALAALFLLPRTPEVASAPIALFSIKPVAEFTRPLPVGVALATDKVALGERLFHDVRLSADDTISCASCHNLSAGGADNRYRSIGIKGGIGAVNAPTVFNSSFNVAQFWDGRAATLEEQVDGPVHHPKEMGSNWPQVMGKLGRDEAYPDLFSRSYRNGLTVDNIKDALATFERSLVTPNSRFDRFLRGEKDSLSAAEKRGYELFQSYGCASCHQGVNLGGNMYERMGMMGDYFGDRGNPVEVDLGRFNVTKKDSDRHYFRVPSLRNVARTAPYFHDGYAANLPEAVRIMAKYQLGRTVSEQDVGDIVAFLETLIGEYKGKPL